MDDHELLRDFARAQSQDAFRQLVDRHLRMVYGVAHRIVRDVHLAEEVAQNVFTLLAKKAAGIVPPQVVAGWLYNSTRHLAMHCVRSEQRRREREETAAAMHLNQSEADPAWVSEHLEEALGELVASERDALVLRFLEDRSLREVGRELGVSEDAARMRVNRAVESVRACFQRRGVPVTFVGFATAISAVTAATAVPPAGLAVSIAAVGLTTTLSTTSTQGILMHWLTSKTMVALTAAVVAGGGAYIAKNEENSKLRQSVTGLERNLASARSALDTTAATNDVLMASVRRMDLMRQDEAGLRSELGRLRLASAKASAEQGELQAKLSVSQAALLEAERLELERSAEEAAKKIRTERFNMLKALTVGARLFYEVGKRFPGTVLEMRGGAVQADHLSEFIEMMPGSAAIPENYPDRILAREKTPRQRPDGKWERSYAFVDGSVQTFVQDSADFSEFEAKQTYKP